MIHEIKMRPWAMALVMLAGALLLLVHTGCRAEEEVKMGFEGEFCNHGDMDCREGLICEYSVCTYPLGGGVTCAQMCERLEFCETNEPNCRVACATTIENWSAQAVEEFGTCIISELTCEEARSNVEQDNASTQTCYERITLDPARRQVCYDFLDAVRDCSPQANTDKLFRDCLLLARTRDDEAFGRKTDGCVERMEDGVCSEIGECLNEVFDLVLNL